MHAIAIALCVLTLSGSRAFAQNQPQTPASAEPAKVDSEKLPISIGRIRLKLAADKTSLLRIQRTIEVVGVAPPIVLWTEEEKATLVNGPSPFGPPTQKDIRDLNAPFKRYPIDLNALMRWLSEQLGDATSKQTK